MVQKSHHFGITAVLCSNAPHYKTHYNKTPFGKKAREIVHFRGNTQAMLSNAEPKLNPRYVNTLDLRLTLLNPA